MKVRVCAIFLLSAALAFAAPATADVIDDAFIAGLSRGHDAVDP